MKSLLVDVLRRANGTPSPDSTPPQPAPLSAPPEAAALESDSLPEEAAMEPDTLPVEAADATRALDLSVAEPHNESLGEHTTRELELRGLSDDLGEPEPERSMPAYASMASAVEHAVVDREVVESDVVDPAMELPVLDEPQLALEAEPQKDASSGVDAAAEPVAPVTVRRPYRDWPATLARWSPALCVMTVTAAAGSLVLYQNMTAQNPTMRLGTPVADAPQSIDEISAAPVWQMLIESSGADSTVAATGADRVSTAAARNDRAGAYQAADKKPPVQRPTRGRTTDPHHDQVRRAYDLYGTGELATAEGLYRDVLTQDRFHREALTGLARTLEKDGRPAEALPLYERLLTLDPQDASVAAVLLASDSTAADSRIKALLQRQPRNAQLHFALGIVMSRRSRWPEAHEAFGAAVRLSPGNADYSFNAAVSAEHLGARSDAERLYTAALADAGPHSTVQPETVREQLDRLATAGRGTMP